MIPVLDYRAADPPKKWKVSLPTPWLVYVIFGFVSVVGCCMFQDAMPRQYGGSGASRFAPKHLDVATFVAEFLAVPGILQFIAVKFTRPRIAVTVAVTLGLYPLFLWFGEFSMLRWRLLY